MEEKEASENAARQALEELTRLSESLKQHAEEPSESEEVTPPEAEQVQKQ